MKIGGYQWNGRREYLGKKLVKEDGKIYIEEGIEMVRKEREQRGGRERGKKREGESSLKLRGGVENGGRAEEWIGEGVGGG